MKSLYYLLLLVFMLSANAVGGQVYINEYSASNLDDFADNLGNHEDWIELYNASSVQVNLGGWYLSDKETKPTKWQIPDGVVLAAGDYMVVWCSGRDSVYNNGMHTNFKLTQTKGNEVLMLVNAAEVVMQQVPMELTQLGHSIGRTTDGADEWKVLTNPTPWNANESSNQYDGYVTTPKLSLEAGFYDGVQTVTITELPTDAEVRYTVDGNEPTTSSPIYTEGLEITLEETQIVKAKAFPGTNNLLPSKIDFNTYFINETFSLPVFSVGADGVQDLANGQGNLRPEGTLEYFDQEQVRQAVSYGELNRHGQDSWILDHRSIDWISRDEMGYNKAVQTKLFTYSERTDYQRFMFRASGDDNYPANDDFNHQGSCHIRDEYVHALSHNGDMKLDVRAVERVVVFLNGEYWGVYGLRERPVDHDYTEEYYNQDKYNLQYLTTWGNTEAEYGGQQAFDDWEEFRDFILTNDMATEENYQYVKDNLQLKGLCDYMIANLNTVASDWLNYNTGWWRGLDPNGGHKKWGYILWDNDATFDYYINYSGVPNTDPDAVACDIDDIADYMDDFFNGNDVGQHEKIFLKLLDESNEFQQLYFSRQADLINTVYSCENMIATFDSMIATIEPEMPRQIDRWGGSMQEWQTNVQQMRLFIQDRCMLIDDGMRECYDLTGMFDITLDVFPVGAGEMEYNTLDISTFPWTGEYFGNMQNKIKAKSLDPDLSFLYWETESGSVIFPDSTDSDAFITLTGTESLTAIFGIPTSINEEEIGLEIAAFPTVFSDGLSVSIELGQAQNISFELINIHGSKVASLSEHNQRYMAGKNQFYINLDQQLPTGAYFLRVNTENAVHTIKLMAAK